MFYIVLYKIFILSFIRVNLLLRGNSMQMQLFCEDPIVKERFIKIVLRNSQHSVQETRGIYNYNTVIVIYMDSVLLKVYFSSYIIFHRLHWRF